jgi:hypothetical protein
MALTCFCQKVIRRRIDARSTIHIRLDVDRAGEANANQSSPPLAGVFNIGADVSRKGEKVGAIGLEPQAESSQPLSDVNPQN